jgi:hypothetical protein
VLILEGVPFEMFDDGCNLDNEKRNDNKNDLQSKN